jgi:hypothetical protein
LFVKNFIDVKHWGEERLRALPALKSDTLDV